MRVLSLFDGISIAQQALKELGYEVEYYASEIDKAAIKIAQKNHPDTMQLGDITQIDCADEKLAGADIHLIIGGSPCQDLSIAKKHREGLDGKRSCLFWEYVRILKELRPKYFVLENVASMSKENRRIITEMLYDIEPVMLDAALFSAQQRKRLFWIGKRFNDADYFAVNIPQPKDRGIYLNDILESEDAVEEKAYYLTTHQKDLINDFIKRHQGNFVFKDKPIRVAHVGKGGRAERIYSIHGKSICLCGQAGGGGGKTGLYLISDNAKRTRDDNVSTDKLKVLKDYFRTLSSVECERLQSLPDNYTEGLCKTTRKRLLGDGFNCEVIKYILRNLL